jgi:3D-(3,5/4)-trihydroxycyclohexane-1,2-dione acylhydrolase (decyclizing)
MPNPAELETAVQLLSNAERPLIIAGGGVLYSGAAEVLQQFARQHRMPVAETQAGKGSLPNDHPHNVGSIGVTGSSAANTLAAEADLVPLEALDRALGDHTSSAAWQGQVEFLRQEWSRVVDRVTAASNVERPSDAQVLGAVNRSAPGDAIVVCAAGGLPGELHKLWRAGGPGGYHLEYGFSCMGYEIAGGLGVKLAHPEREVFVLVGDGSYLMLNSELATAVMLGRKLTVVVLDNRGYGCINRLQRATGGASFNNLFDHVDHVADPAEIDFAGHARALGAAAEKAQSIADLELALARARESDRSYAIVIDTDPLVTTQEGGAWWDVAVPETSARDEVREAHEANAKARARQKLA